LTERQPVFAHPHRDNADIEHHRKDAEHGAPDNSLNPDLTASTGTASWQRKFGRTRLHAPAYAAS
jgi:hypothetical protein